MEIKNLAAMKRAIATPGIIIRVVSHWQPQLVGTTRQPKPTRNGGKPGIQTNGYWFDGLNRDRKTVEMWADTPKASQLKFKRGWDGNFLPRQRAVLDAGF